jgi:hypothetical protein
LYIYAMNDSTTSNKPSKTVGKQPRHALELRARAKAAGIHLLISLLIAALAASLVFLLWYPWPFRIVSGGEELFLLIISVDVILGPLLTFAVFNRAKPRSELKRDLTVVVLLQMAALAYGLYTVYLARPVVVAYETDRLRVVTHVQVQHEQLPAARPEFRELSLTGPRLVGTRNSKSDELIKSVDESLQGIDVSMRPSYWVPYAESKDRVLKRARGLDVLHKQYPQHKAALDAAVAKTGKSEGELRFLPLQARNLGWSALLDASTGEPLGYVPLDGFF